MVEAAATAGPELAFGPDEYRSRLDRVRAAMASANLDLLFLSAPESICYLSGYQAEWRSEERRVGKECRYRCVPCLSKMRTMYGDVNVDYSTRRILYSVDFI